MAQDTSFETDAEEDLTDEALDRNVGGGRFSTCAITKVDRY